MDPIKVSGKKSKKGKSKRESLSSNLDSSFKGKLNEGDKIEKEKSSTETEFPPKFTVIIDPQHPCSKSIKTSYATFLHPSILQAFQSPWYFYIKGEHNESLCVAYPLKTVKRGTIVFPKDTMGFVHEELVTLYPYPGIVNNAAAVTVAFDANVSVNAKVKERVLDALIRKKFFYKGMRLNFMSLDHCEFTVTCISPANPGNVGDSQSTLNVSERKFEETDNFTSNISEVSFTHLSSQFSAMNLNQNESKISQYSDTSFQFDPKMLPEPIIPTFFTVYHGTSLKLQPHADDNTEYTDFLSGFAQLGGLEQELQEIKAVIDMFLDSENPFQHKVGVLFLSGPSGTGKSSILKAICEEYNTHIEEILWYDVYSKPLSEGVKELRQIFKNARSRTPSIILIDDINYLAPMNAVQDTISSILLQEIENCMGEQVVIVAASSDSNYNKEVLNSCDILVEDMKLQMPDTNQREDIIFKLLKNVKHELSSENIKSLSLGSQGFTGKDLKDVLKDAAACCFLKMEKSLVLNKGRENVITFSDVRNALNRKKPSISQSEVKIKKVKWEDIGGMAEVKKKLKEIVEGPLKFPEMYKRFGMKPSRGVLLYGPPGCSKTMIAKALATECDLSFISKNVSDIHNKYVGESEKAVSNLFVMARAKSPCIIFLDEIDALIPSRGSSTGSGVEERVVNVFLQELDGIEELNDVIIVAATNRPDRIDEAFLRYGRINHYLYIPLPDIEAREEILKLQMRKRTVSSDFDYKSLALKTEGYSGAEIVNLCNEAAFQLLNEDLDCKCPIFTMKHFEKALLSILPRTNRQLLEFFENFNSKFCQR